MIDNETYIKEYLADDMNRMGFLFEYCDSYAKDIYKVEINKPLFVNAFMKSYIRELMDKGHPRLLSQSSQDTFEAFIETDLQNDLSTIILYSETNEYKTYQMYWIGQMYAYIHFMTSIPSSEIIELLSFDEMVRLYPLGHEMDIEVFYDRIKCQITRSQSD